MEILPLLLKEFEEEAKTTRKFLKRVPIEKFSWKPHEKSMTMKNLVVHIAELPGWVEMTLHTDGLDFATSPYTPTKVSMSEELLDLHHKSYESGKKALEEANEDELWLEWTLQNGEQILSKRTKYETVRMSFSQTIHHRAQLGVYLRLLNIPIPGSYGPSADEAMF